MTAHIPISHETDVNMTSKGQVLIPKPIRDQIGLHPGKTVRVGINDRGETVVLPKASAETKEQRAARIRSALEAARGTMSTGFATTDDYMAFIRPRTEA